MLHLRSSITPVSRDRLYGEAYWCAYLLGCIPYTRIRAKRKRNNEFERMIKLEFAHRIKASEQEEKLQNIGRMLN